MGKKKYYLTLDTETCTLPFADTIATDSTAKQKISIAKPLVYDIGWVISDRNGNIVKTANYLVQETFFVPSVFNTAYYKEKREMYIHLYEQGKIQAKMWDMIMLELMADLQDITAITAYNATFDFKKAIPFTEKYINNLYSTDFEKWLDKQKAKCYDIIKGKPTEKNPTYLTPIFELREMKIPLIDLWGLACERCLNNTRYKNFCLKNKLLTKSGEYFSTSAESAFKYLAKDVDFVESHTALSDALIETQILVKILKKGAIKEYLKPFPFRTLGTTITYLQQYPKYTKNVLEMYTLYEQTCNSNNYKYKAKIKNTISILESLLNE